MANDKEMNSFFIKLIENLDVKMTNLTTDIGKTHTDLALIKQTLDGVLTQVKATNGRVTCLEGVATRLQESNVMLTTMVSKQDGIYKQNQLELSKWRGDTCVEIDEIKKKVNMESVGELDIKKISTDYSGRIKLAVITGVISILTITATALLSFKAGENNLPTTITNINK